MEQEEVNFVKAINLNHRHFPVSFLCHPTFSGFYLSLRKKGSQQYHIPSPKAKF